MRIRTIPDNLYQLTMEQQFHMAKLKSGCDHMSIEQMKDLLLETTQNALALNNAVKYLMVIDND